MSVPLIIKLKGHVPLEYDIEHCSIASDLKDKLESEHESEQQTPTKEL